MRALFAILLLSALLVGCNRLESYPGQQCDYTCNDASLECIGYRCVAVCELEGDCTLGKRCVDGYCLSECEEAGDCGDYGVCKQIGAEYRGSACALENLPECLEDWHCDSYLDLCRGGRCIAYCNEYQPCVTGQLCELEDDYNGVCKTDPDYVPPILNCADAPDPDQWCLDAQRGSTCLDSQRRCASPIVGFAISDTSYVATGDGSCPINEFDDMPGFEVQRIAAYDSAGEPLRLQIQTVIAGVGDIRYSEAVLSFGLQCADDPPVMSPGCQGTLVIVNVDEAGNAAGLPPASLAEVVEVDAACGEEDPDRFELHLCRDLTAIGGEIVCDLGAFAIRTPGDASTGWLMPL